MANHLDSARFWAEAVAAVDAVYNTPALLIDLKPLAAAGDKFAAFVGDAVASMRRLPQQRFSPAVLAAKWGRMLEPGEHQLRGIYGWCVTAV
jgi:hypothetical protein